MNKITITILITSNIYLNAYQKISIKDFPKIKIINNKLTTICETKKCLLNESLIKCWYKISNKPKEFCKLTLIKNENKILIKIKENNLNNTQKKNLINCLKNIKIENINLKNIKFSNK
jgi:hypothetical protein